MLSPGRGGRGAQIPLPLLPDAAVLQALGRAGLERNCVKQDASSRKRTLSGNRKSELEKKERDIEKGLKDEEEDGREDRPVPEDEADDIRMTRKIGEMRRVMKINGIIHIPRTSIFQHVGLVRSYQSN